MVFFVMSELLEGDLVAFLGSYLAGIRENGAAFDALFAELYA